MIMTKKITDEPGSGTKRAKRASNDALLVRIASNVIAISSELLLQRPRQRYGRLHGCETQTVVHRDRVDQGNNHFVLSPGITISTPSGSSMVPVTQ